MFKIKVYSFLGFLCCWVRMELWICNICHRLWISILVFIHAFIYNFLADGVVVAFIKRIWVDILLNTKILFFNHFSRKRNVFEFFDTSTTVLSVKKSRRLKFWTLNINIFHLMFKTKLWWTFFIWNIFLNPTTLCYRSNFLLLIVNTN